MGPTVTTFDVPDVRLFCPVVHRDARGHFVELWRNDQFAGAGLKAEFVQDNLSRSQRGVLRGLHFQREPHAQGKLVGVVRGAILDVAVDLRRDSPTFGRHVATVLDDRTLARLWVPRGFAHGFIVLSAVADVLYKVDNVHAPRDEGGIRWDDPALGIDWGPGTSGLPGGTPLVSARDMALPGIHEADFAFGWERT